MAVYSKLNQTEILNADEYLKKFKFNFLKNVVKDPDINKLLVCFVLILIIKFIFIFKNKKDKNLINNGVAAIYLGSILSFFAFLFMPNSRFGGYNFLSFFLFTIFFIKFNKNILKDDIRYALNIFLLIGIVGTIDSYNKSKREKLVGILFAGIAMHIAGFYPLLNVKTYFVYNNIIYVFGLIALAIVYLLPYACFASAVDLLQGAAD